MRFENEKVVLAPLNLIQLRNSGKIVGAKTRQEFAVNGEQIGLLEMFVQGASISQAVNKHFERRIFINFVALRQMIAFLVSENIILNHSFHLQFDPRPIESRNFFESLLNNILGPKTGQHDYAPEIAKLPFFRSLKKELLDVLLAHAELIEAPSHVTVCQTGGRQRSLFVLIEGQAAVIKDNDSIAMLSAGSVFGEVGFFLGEPRTASVITTKKSLILRIKYKPEVFDSQINTQFAHELQKRFRVIHALLKSKMFRDIPQDCFDALIFSGQIKEFSANQQIFAEGDLGAACYIIVQGQAVVSQKNEIIRELGQGDCFGEIALILTGGKRSASVHSIGELTVLELPTRNFYSLLAENLLLACQFEKLALQRIHGDQRF
jgi:CRP-like cAMP-binding protein